MDAPVLVLAGVRATLERPSPLVEIGLVRTPEQVAAMAPAESWALSALALLECWPMSAAWPAPLRPRRWRVGESMPERGREVFDGLIAAGVPYGALLGKVGELGVLEVAAQWATDRILSPKEVDAARDFCVVRADGKPGSDSAFAGGITSPLPGGTG